MAVRVCHGPSADVLALVLDDVGLGITATAALLAFGCFGGLLPARGHPTFLEGFALAAETSGLPIFVSGAVGGLVYWLVLQRDERLKQMRSIERIEADATAHRT